MLTVEFDRLNLKPGDLVLDMGAGAHVQDQEIGRAHV